MSSNGELILPAGKIELLCGIFILIFTEFIMLEKSPLVEVRKYFMYNSLTRISILVFFIIAISFLGYDETSAFIYFRY